MSERLRTSCAASWLNSKNHSQRGDEIASSCRAVARRDTVWKNQVSVHSETAPFPLRSKEFVKRGLSLIPSKRRRPSNQSRLSTSFIQAHACVLTAWTTFTDSALAQTASGMGADTKTVEVFRYSCAPMKTTCERRWPWTHSSLLPFSSDVPA